MKQYISRLLKSISAVFMVFPIVYIIMTATLFDIPLSRCIGILLSPLYYVVSLCVMGAGYGLWEVRRWSWYLLLISQFLVGYENAILVQGYAESHHKIFIFLVSILAQGLLISVIAKEIRVPYFFPRIRWWESNPRYRLSVPVSIVRGSGETREGDILDIAMAGCFIKQRSDWTQDESVTLQFKIFGFEIRCPGKVVWLAQSTVTYPQGVGVKFGLLLKDQKRPFRVITRKLRRIASLYRRSRYLMSQEEFLKQLEVIESTSQEGTKLNWMQNG